VPQSAPSLKTTATPSPPSISPPPLPSPKDTLPPVAQTPQTPSGPDLVPELMQKPKTGMAAMLGAGFTQNSRCKTTFFWQYVCNAEQAPQSLVLVSVHVMRAYAAHDISISSTTYDNIFASFQHAPLQSGKLKWDVLGQLLTPQRQAQYMISSRELNSCMHVWNCRGTPGTPTQQCHQAQDTLRTRPAGSWTPRG